MKKVLKKITIGLVILMVLLMSSAFVFGSTTHSDLSGSKEKKVQEFMREYTKKEPFDGTVLVLQKGEVLLNQSYGLADKENDLPFTNELQFPIGSITKSMTATAILQLEEEGRLSLTDKLYDYLPEFPNAELITLKQLLNHSSGLNDYLEVNEIMGNYTKAFSEEEILNSIKDLPLKFVPGKKYDYVNTNYYLLGKVIEKVSRQKYHDYLTDRIFKPAGMNDTFVMNEKNKSEVKVRGYENDRFSENLHTSLMFGCGDVVSTKADLAKYVYAIETNLLLSQKQKNKMTSSTIEMMPTQIGYGYGWYVSDNIFSFNEKEYSHGGSMPGLRSGLMSFPEKDIIIVIFSNNGSEWNYVKLGNEIVSILLDKRMWFIHKLQ